MSRETVGVLHEMQLGVSPRLDLDGTVTFDANRLRPTNVPVAGDVLGADVRHSPDQ